jgi:hypothetical protein
MKLADRWFVISHQIVGIMLTKLCYSLIANRLIKLVENDG